MAWVDRPSRPSQSGALRRPLAASQGLHQPRGQQELRPLDHHHRDRETAHRPDVPAQPLAEWGAAALQVHDSLSCVLVQAQGPKAALVVDSGSIFPGVDAAGSGKAAGLDPRGAAVKVPAWEGARAVSLEGSAAIPDRTL